MVSYFYELLELAAGGNKIQFLLGRSTKFFFTNLSPPSCVTSQSTFPVKISASKLILRSLNIDFHDFGAEFLEKLIFKWKDFAAQVFVMLFLQIVLCVFFACFD